MNVSDSDRRNKRTRGFPMPITLHPRKNKNNNKYLVIYQGQTENILTQVVEYRRRFHLFCATQAVPETFAIFRF